MTPREPASLQGVPQDVGFAADLVPLQVGVIDVCIIIIKPAIEIELLSNASSIHVSTTPAAS